MSARLGPLSAQQSSSSPASKDKSRAGHSKRSALRKTSYITENSTNQTDRGRQEAQAKQQPSPVKLPKERKRRLGTVDSSRSSNQNPRKRARQCSNKAVVWKSVNEEERDPVGHWTKTYQWPKGYLVECDKNMSHLLARQQSSGSLRRKRPTSASVEPVSAPSSLGQSSTTPSDQKPREIKSAPYQDPRYETLLATKGSFMGRPPVTITQSSKESYLNLLDARQTIPQDSPFCDELFEETCEMIRNKNEARVIRDISQLIVPSAEILAARGAKSLKILAESVNEGWNNSIPLTGTRPQPDFSVGFRREAFTKEQLDRIAPFIGNFISGDQSFFMATYYMYFPFLTCEVKCGAAALDIADRQNAHSMTIAVRATVELFRLVGWEKKLHREILGFSISHDHRSVRIYGHYPVIDGKDTKYYRHSIHTFDFTALDGRERWTSYKFIKNVYEVWMPNHFKQLCSAIDKIAADVDFSVPELFRSLGLSQDFEHYHLSESSVPGSPSKERSQQSTGGAQDTSPDTSFTGQGASKRPRRELDEGG